MSKKRIQNCSNSVILTLSLLLFAVCLTAQTPSCRRQLKVSMYPFIPNADNFYKKLETEFEKVLPDVDLIINQNADYYDETLGLITEEADIYEIDCIMLNDFVAKKKIQKLANETLLSPHMMAPTTMVPAARNILINSGYVFPHWVCANFLISNAADAPMSGIKTLGDLERVIGKNPTLKNGLLIDMKGKLTLGELYADALFDHYNNLDTLKKYANVANLNKPTIDNLNRIPDLTYSNWGRVDSYHDKTGFYQKQFAKGNGRALVGYSESLYHIMNEIGNSCYNEEGCVANNLEISEVPFSDKGSNTLGWVDAFGIDSKVTGAKLHDANNFIIFLLTDMMYRKALIPDWGDAPRYLLPAFRHLYTDAEILKTAPYYTKLLPLVEKVTTFSSDGISPALRQIGKKLDKEYLKN
jgi:thiamine pyridinylase